MRQSDTPRDSFVDEGTDLSDGDEVFDTGRELVIDSGTIKGPLAPMYPDSVHRLFYLLNLGSSPHATELS